MNNKKYTLSLPLAIIGIVIHGIFIILSAFAALYVILITGFTSSNGVTVIALLFFLSAAEIAGLSVSISICVKCARKTLDYSSLLFILAILNIICFILPLFILLSEKTLFVIFIAPTFFFGALSLFNIITLTIINEKPFEPPITTETNISSPLDDSIAELNKLRELKIISDEQFNAAILNVITKTAEK